MPNPRLLHPIPVTLELLNREAMTFDADAREGLHGARSKKTDRRVLPAQIKWSDKDEPVPEAGGMREVSRGYILVDRDDMRRGGFELKRGDRICKIGEGENELVVDLYLLGQEPMAHYPNKAGAPLMKYNFGDRHPVRQTGDL